MAVTGTAPIVSSGGATPTISITAANSTSNGTLSSTDFTKLASALQPNANVSILVNDAAYVRSNTAGVSGANVVINIMSLTQAQYNAITPANSTFYVII